MIMGNWNIRNLPPEGHPDVGPFFYSLWEMSYHERLRLNLEERWFENHRLFRGKHWNMLDRFRERDQWKQTFNLIFANTIRTVANITARNPVAEVVGTDGVLDDAGKILTQKTKDWWNETEQPTSIARSALNNEIYGITIEKAFYNKEIKQGDIAVLDAFSYYPYPGYYEDLNDCPCHCHATVEDTATIESQYELKPGDVSPDDVYSIMGEDREENWISPAGTRTGSMNYPGNYSDITHPIDPKHIRAGRAMLIEIWVRDYSTIVNEVEEIFTDENGVEVVEKVKTEIPRYPGNIRVVRLTNRGNIVLEDIPNPNVNPALPVEVASKTYLFNHFPFYKANSYEDTTSIWGFSASEQVGDINKKIDETISRIGDYVSKVLMPPLIVPLDTGITKDMIQNKAGLVLQPLTSASAQGIHYLQVPNIPSNFFEILDIYLKLFDRIHQIEDADRGDVPNRIVSGAAIAALQERNAVMIRAKIRSIDYLCRQRGRCAISMLQNFGVIPEVIEVEGSSKELIGIQYAGREFNFVVESGSTVARTSLQVQEQAVELFKLQAIDRRALLETLNFPGWKSIVERMGETQIDTALGILVEAGLPIPDAQSLKELLSQIQGGPGDTQQNPPEDMAA